MARTLAIDFGTSKSGLAISDVNNIFASKFGIVKSSNLKNFSELIQKIVSSNNIGKILIGLPDEKDYLGNESQIYLKILSVSKVLKNAFKVKVAFWDESMTTVLAKENSKKRLIDDESARIILQEYLDFKNKK